MPQLQVNIWLRLAQADLGPTSAAQELFFLFFF